MPTTIPPERSFGCPPELEKFREIHPITQWPGDEANGALFVKPARLTILFSNGGGWEHVSVSRKGRCPAWEDMCWVKEKFWGPEVLVVQYHPRRDEYINCHPHCLHLWRSTDHWMPSPPSIFVGPRP